MPGLRSRLPRVWKVLLALVLVLPMAAFVAGSLVASAADEPAPRDPIVITEQPSPRPSRTPAPSPEPPPTRSEDDRDSGDDDDVEVVTPEPAEVDDEDDRTERDDDRVAADGGDED